jgi:cyclophilin family peptidyl-prolyl cis-trans isomerase/predicted GIY-YIG superfamily endonuclease
MVERMQEKERGARKKRGERWSLYIIKCSDESLYTGIAKDVERRLKMHREGKGARYTRTRRPLEMVYQESCRTRTEALVRECAVKALPKAKKLALIERFRPPLALALVVTSLLLAGCETAEPKREVSTTEGEEVVKIKIETTLGDIYADLYPEAAPRTVENFVALARKKFYDGILFHRVIPGFMIQTGDPTGTGRGGPGYEFDDEFSPRARHSEKGVLSMANAGPNTNGSQFFITLAPTPWLDDRHSVFGKVTRGIEVAEKISNLPRNAEDRPLEEVRMVRVEILNPEKT